MVSWVSGKLVGGWLVGGRWSVDLTKPILKVLLYSLRRVSYVRPLKQVVGN